MNLLKNKSLIALASLGVFLGSFSMAYAVSIIYPGGGGTGWGYPGGIQAHTVLIGNGINPVSTTSPNTAGFVLTSNGASADPTFQVSSGGIPIPVSIANGGTNNSAAYTAGSVIFSDGTKLTQDNSNFFWDDTNNRLGIGTTSPTTLLEVSGSQAGTSLTTLAQGVKTSITNTDTTTNNYEALNFRTNDAVGAGTTTSMIAGINTDHSASSVSGAMAFFTASSSTLIERMRITSAGNVGIGNTAPASLLALGTAGGTITRTSWTTTPPMFISTNQTLIDNSSAPGSTIVTRTANVFAQPTYGFATGTSTITDAANVYISGAPRSDAASSTIITNSSALFIQNGSLAASGVITNGYGLTVNAPTAGATNLYAARFLGGSVGIGTSSPQWPLTSYSNSAAQLALSYGAGYAQWAFRNAGGNLYLATTTVAGTATSTFSAFTILTANGFTGIASSTPGSLLSIGNTNGINFTTATSTFAGTGGLNIINGGCYAINGVCISGGGGGGSGTVTSVGLSSTNSTLSIGSSPVTTSGTITADLNTGHSNWWTATQNFTNASTSAFTATSSVYLATTGGNVGIGATSTPASILSIQGVANFVASGISTIYNDLKIVGNLFLPSLATPAGTYLAADPTGRVIATTSPSVGNTITPAYKKNSGNDAEVSYSVVAGDTVQFWVYARGSTCNAANDVTVFANYKQSTMAATTTLDTGINGGQAVSGSCSANAMGSYTATTTETVNIQATGGGPSDTVTVMAQKIH